MYKCLEVQVPTEPLKLVEKPIPVPPSKGLVIKTESCGMCHTDIAIADNYMKLADGFEDNTLTQYDPDFKYPVVMGHEVAGTVYSIGDGDCLGSEELEVGDRVAVYTFQGCQNCKLCNTGNHLMCDRRQCNDLGQGGDGGYAEYVSIPNRKFVFKLPDSITMDTACLFSCSALTAYNAVTKTKPAIENALNIFGSATLLIIGAGGLGQWAIQIARAVLPTETKILVADISADRLAAVQESVDMTVEWSTDDDMSFMTKVKEVTGSEFVEASIDFVGNPVSMKRAMWLGNKGSTHCIVGLLGGATTFPVPFIPCKVMDIHGIYLGSTQQMQEVIKLAATGKIVAPPMEYCRLEEVNDVLNRLRKGKINGRAIIKFD
ncbi:unnamed protein product [Owenia fusiformis]|uniref:Uncharacterized protein n=1 Tax=Owenia fusiformis TaxID=6347 RepID=A0A8J1Y8U5_OWEFU|nr:unnamed protein product [Owenia fusiformis]